MPRPPQEPRRTCCRNNTFIQYTYVHFGFMDEYVRVSNVELAAVARALITRHTEVTRAARAFLRERPPGAAFSRRRGRCSLTKCASVQYISIHIR